MTQVPTDRTVASSIAEHTSDHNIFAAQHNELDGHAADTSTHGFADGAALLDETAHDALDHTGLTGVGGGSAPTWTGYTPTLTQSATVTKTVTYAEYMEQGTLVFVRGVLAVTGTGTSANAVVIGLPVAADFTVGAPGFGFVCGVGKIRDDSATQSYLGIVNIVSTTTFQVMPLVPGTNVSGLGASQFTAALATGDGIVFSLQYKKA